jgi:hypothetical protein
LSSTRKVFCVDSGILLEEGLLITTVWAWIMMVGAAAADVVGYWKAGTGGKEMVGFAETRSCGGPGSRAGTSESIIWRSISAVRVVCSCVGS